MTTRHYPLELDPDVAKCLNCRALRAVRAFNLNSADEADLRQEAYLHLLRYAPTFDPSKSSWKTFIEMLIETGINMYLRQCLRYRRELSGGDPVYTEHLFSVEGPSELSKSMSLMAR